MTRPLTSPIASTVACTAADRREVRRQVRRGLLFSLTALVPLMPLALAGCVSAAPAPRLLRLPTQPPEPALSAATAAAAPGGWQLLPWGTLPEWMDRHEVLVADGPAGLRALPGVRWAEPLRDTLPRLLALDLAAVRAPQPLWAGPLPPGAAVQRQLRVQVLALDNLPRSGQVQLLAQWSLADPTGAQPPLQAQERISQPWDGSVDGLVLSQRLAVWALARRIGRAQPPSAPV